MDIINKFGVGATSDRRIGILKFDVSMDREEALLLAAWIVALADPLDEDFTKILEAVRST